MSYLALYRKFRPTDFDSVVEQKHITTTLKNQIIQGRIGHAYLFTGTRGTGKTSVAKIFARAVNCLNPQNGNPCGKCEACLSLGKPDNMDVIEMDAASNNGVDDLRDLRDKVAFQPVIGKYKVYIIDEVHMLSGSAFNALLKTLEEPPKHVIFILATTEPQKIPATILSRCMRFDFRLIPTEKIFEYLKKVYKKVGKTAEDEALYAIARAGEGSMRDALSIADMCLSVSDGALKFSDVSEIIGNLSREGLYELFTNLVNKNAAKVLDCVDGYVKAGKNIQVITRDAAQLFRDLCVIKLSGADSLNYPKDVIEKMTDLSSIVDSSYLLRGLDVFSELESKFKYSLNPRLLLETALLKLTDSEYDVSVSALYKRVTELERKLERGIIDAPKKSTRDSSDNINAEKPLKTNSFAENSVEEKDSNSIKDDSNLNDSNNAPSTISSETENAESAEDKLRENEILKGKIIRQFRLDGDFVLLSAISYTTLDTMGSKIIFSVSSEDNRKFLSEKNHSKNILKAVKEQGYDTFELKVKDNKDAEKEQKIINNANALSGDMLKIEE